MSSKTLPWLFLAACASGPAVRAPADAAATLQVHTQALLDAVTSGDARVWDRLLDPEVLYVSEAGELERKPQLLAEVVPLPAGISGRIAIGKFEARVHGDTAIVFHLDEEYENYFGHDIHAQYLNLATWRYAHGEWRMIATQVLAALIDPPAIALTAEQLDEYQGSFALTPDIHYTIKRDGDHLVGQRTGRPPQVLQVEARDVFFVAGQPRSRKIFLRDAAGKIAQFTDRREARDVIWNKAQAQ